MNKNDLNELVTKQDLENFKVAITELILSKVNPAKQFYTPKEFKAVTGMPYSTVVDKCAKGKIKAYQESPKCSWLIYATEIERYIKEADENFDNNH
jgi:hypothetical protein